MDPNACLERFWKACDAGDLAEAYYAQDDLQTWLLNGGAHPDWNYHAVGALRSQGHYLDRAELVRRVCILFPKVLD